MDQQGLKGLGKQAVLLNGQANGILGKMKF